MELIKCEIETQTRVDVVVPDKYREKLLDWVYEQGGRCLRSGPEVVELRATNNFHVIATIPGVRPVTRIMEELKAL